MLARSKALSSRGDTIIEIMIVLAVLGMAISLSYATANRSLLNARQAQENSEATQIAQSQIEALRTLANDTSQNIYQSGPYCISTPPYTIQTGNACISSGGIPYTTDIRQINTNNHTIRVIVTWPDVRGDGNDTVTMYYRVHPT